MISINVDAYFELVSKGRQADEWKRQSEYNYELLRQERRKNTRLRWRLEQIREALEEVTSV